MCASVRRVMMLSPFNITCKIRGCLLIENKICPSYFSKIISSYSTNEDAAVEDGHGDGNFQGYPFADTNVKVWCLIRSDVTAEEM